MGMNKNRGQRGQGKAASANRRRPAVGFTIPPANRGGRWVCQRKDCARKPVNFGVVCACCGRPARG